MFIDIIELYARCPSTCGGLGLLLAQQLIGVPPGPPQAEATTVAGPERGGLFCGGQRGLVAPLDFARMCVAPVTLIE